MKLLTLILCLVAAASTAFAHAPILPDVTGDPDARVVAPGETLEVDGELRVSTLVVHPGGTLVCKPNSSIVILDRQPTSTANPDTNQLDVGIVGAGTWLGEHFEVRSENPSGHRGHILWTGHGFVDIHHVAFRDLGRTTTAPLNETTNKIGRYSGIHFHHMWGPNPPIAPYQFRVEDFEIHGSPKWGMVIHSSHFGVIRRGVIRDCVGAGLVFEGFEAGNVVEDIEVTGSVGNGLQPTQRNNAFTDFGFEGAGLWMRMVGSNVVRNVKVRNSRFGAVVLPAPSGPPYTYRVPLKAGANPDGPDGQSVYPGDASLYRPIEGLDTDESVEVGFEAWNLFNVPPALLKNCQLGARRLGAKAMFVRQVAFENVEFAAPLGFVHQGESIPSGYMDFLRFTGCTFQGAVGAALRTRDGATFKDCQFDCPVSTKFYRRHDMPCDVTLDNCTHAGQAVWREPTDWVDLARPPEANNALEPTRFLVKEPAGNFRLYFPEQAADYVLPASTGVLIGSPESGLTNAHLLSKYGLAAFGDVAPCQATREGYDGLACPTTEQSLAPHVTLVRNGRWSRSGASITSTFTTTAPCTPLLARLNGFEWRQAAGPLGVNHAITFQNRPQQTQALVYVRTEQGTISQLNVGTVAAGPPVVDHSVEIAALKAEQQTLTSERAAHVARIVAIDSRLVEIQARLAEITK